MTVSAMQWLSAVILNAVYLSSPCPFLITHCRGALAVQHDPSGRRHRRHCSKLRGNLRYLRQQWPRALLGLCGCIPGPRFRVRQ